MGKKKSKSKIYSAPLLFPDQTRYLPTFTPDNTYFTADTHFYGTTIIQHRTRFSDVETMNETLIKNWNETVPEDGVVFHLGDFCSGATKDKIIELKDRLHGSILLINGNHDDISLYRSKRFQERTSILLLGYQWEIKLDGRKILLNHYPYLCYAGEYEGVWQLFGHVHSGIDKAGYDTPRLKHLLPFQYDVGVDNNKDRPVSFLTLKEIMRRKEKSIELVHFYPQKNAPR